METDLLIAHGNTCREQRNPDQALAFYAQAFVQDPTSVAAFNNYGNVMREMGFPDRAQPFLEHAIRMDPANEVARFNLAVCYLLLGDYAKGWPAYEDRWSFEHLKGLMPSFSQPRWTGQTLKDKAILVVGEQGIGDTLQFSRFALDLLNQGARVILAVSDNLVSLFGNHPGLETISLSNELPKFDYWTPIMSIPGNLNITLDKLISPISYISPNQKDVSAWNSRLGPKQKLRIGFSWSGRRDTWINQHKSVPLPLITNLIANNPQYEWVNLQVDATDEESAELAKVGVKTYPGTISTISDTAALISCLDVVISVDTAISHLSAAIGKTTWIMLNHYAVDWRWLLNRADSPWYPTARLFRQPSMDNWGPVLTQIEHHLKLFKI